MGLLDWLFGKKKVVTKTKAMPLPAKERDALDGNEWVEMAREARRMGDIDQARICYQRAAYGYKTMEPEAVEALKHEVARFTAEDSRFQDAWRVVRGVLEKHPGTLQSELGKQTGDNREWFNYVMYYAEFTDLLVRVKAGRSYRLFLPGQPIPPPPEKPKRIRRTKENGQ